ncbi:alanine racemase [Trypanosoma conorhini]|uniref:Alanine racemase n=1 Tax=Trypanosoma conorhini TaxID=83891 RepID=A0A3R7KWZ1_9TRYP|nr:alanine racemase [Trypanosoma conorhini]RNF16814.1 alanine racemase [Trypanosoma conorhini]
MRHSTYLEVSLRNIADNVECVRRLAGAAEVIAMVKGNAYGHGMETVSRYLHDACGVRNFGVASLGEALLLRATQPCIATDPRSEIFVFSDTEVMNEGCQSYYEQGDQPAARLTPVLATVSQLKAFCASAAFDGTKLCLKLNTGMNRLGLRPDELAEVLPLLRQRGGVDHLLQHFSVAAAAARRAETQAHYDTFKRAVQFLRDGGVEVRATSVSNSGAVEQRIGLEETYVRPGLMLYGPRSVTDQRLWAGKPASCLYTKVLHHFPVRRGEGVGYGLEPTSADAVVVMLPLGYADGFIREYKGMAVTVTPDGAADPIAGTVHGSVNMDMTAVVVYPEEVGKDIGAIMAAVKDEARIRVWGEDVGEKAASVGSIPNQLFCGISIRVPRVYTT